MLAHKLEVWQITYSCMECLFMKQDMYLDRECLPFICTMQSHRVKLRRENSRCLVYGPDVIRVYFVYPLRHATGILLHTIMIGNRIANVPTHYTTTHEVSSSILDHEFVSVSIILIHKLHRVRAKGVHRLTSFGC